MSYLGNSPTEQAFVATVDYFNGDGSTVAFTLSRQVTSVAQVQAVIENVPQNPSSAFTVLGNVITFTSAPPVGTANIYVYYTSPNTKVIAPSSGTVGTDALAAGAVTENKLADLAVTPAKLSQKLTSGTAVATTSGTSIDFTSIPSWVKRITVMFNGVSGSGSSLKQIQIGTSGGVQTTGYITFASYTGAASGGATATSGFLAEAGSGGNTNIIYGNAVLTLLDSATGLWTYSATLGMSSGGNYTVQAGGNKTLSGTLDRIRITTVNGTDTFDAGSINILYEG